MVGGDILDNSKEKRTPEIMKSLSDGMGDWLNRKNLATLLKSEDHPTLEPYPTPPLTYDSDSVTALLQDENRENYTIEHPRQRQYHPKLLSNPSFTSTREKSTDEKNSAGNSEEPNYSKGSNNIQGPSLL